MNKESSAVTPITTDEPWQSEVYLGDDLRCETRGRESDLLWFTINHAVIARDNIRDHTISSVSSKQDGNTHLVAVVFGAERDLVFGYAIIGNTVYRSPKWRDQKAGNLNLSGVDWSNNNTFSIDGRGTMSFSGTTWHCTAGSEAVIQGGQITLTP